YPAIYRLAIDILPIQGTSVPSECIIFSTGETNTNRHSQLSAELMMQALQVLKFSIKSKGMLSFS
ncbi:hypothetical protein BT96DRAFT_839837, partial [Gymnopus androsaceus JB14]